MSEKRRRPQRETVQALVGVTVIVIGLLVTLVLHLTHDSHDPQPSPSPLPTATAPPASPSVAAAGHQALSGGSWRAAAPRRQMREPRFAEGSLQKMQRTLCRELSA
ncbi:hypothetical protein [Embleya sp. NPDC020630]|uniref:hypothetical protein n=1 Tax=Embleya sp. NPDC020630 TaxID=3363979 RepID=UPI0037AC7DE3